MNNVFADTENKIWQLLQQVKDPEVPVLSVIDLGIVRNIVVNEKDVTVYITPTYSGCPALDVIGITARLLLTEHGYKNVIIKQVLSPAWSTDDMSEAGKQKLKAFGIAPPHYKINEANKNILFAKHKAVQCPHCNSLNTFCISEFGSTACKALYKCYSCNEPFDHFKCH
jgi:ring-1,2-phenylacetyl-CoA epoxidase subunit PaaD